MTRTLDHTDRAILNRLQAGLPVTARPFADVAAELDIAEDDLLARLQGYLDRGLLTRFGPMFNAEKLGGEFCLCAMEVPPDRFDEVAEIVNAFDQVAHNYERDHRLNMWFVLATARPEDIAEVAAKIEQATGLQVLLFPKEREFFVELRVAV